MILKDWLLSFQKELNMYGPLPFILVNLVQYNYKCSINYKSKLYNKVRSI